MSFGSSHLRYTGTNFSVRLSAGKLTPHDRGPFLSLRGGCENRQYVVPNADPAALPVWNPPAEIVTSSNIPYASLLSSLLAAFVATFGKRWLGCYLRHTERSIVERCSIMLQYPSGTPTTPRSSSDPLNPYRNPDQGHSTHVPFLSIPNKCRVFADEMSATEKADLAAMKGESGTCRHTQTCISVQQKE